jgi:hypothetical protein
MLIGCYMWGGKLPLQLSDFSFFFPNFNGGALATRDGLMEPHMDYYTNIHPCLYIYIQRLVISSILHVVLVFFW